MPGPPMLARAYRDGDVARWGGRGALVQPKLDGVRMLGARGGVLVSRNFSSFAHLARVRASLDAVAPPGVVLDGELYIPGGTFAEVVSAVRTVRTVPGARAEQARVEFWVFDVAAAPGLPPGAPYSQRLALLRALLPGRAGRGALRLVPTRHVRDDAGARSELLAALRAGYEGVVLRDPASAYEAGRRAAGLLKLKDARTEEFEVIGVEEARGKDAGTAVLVCRAAGGRPFRVRPSGSRAERAELLSRGRMGLLAGRLYTVRFQEMTRDGVPRFPVGVALRNYE